MPETLPDITKEHLIETYRGMIALATGALKAVLFLNGGAAIALLAFLSNIWGWEGDSGALDLVVPMIWFVAGLVMGGVGFLTAYLTQLALYNESLLPYKKFAGWRDHRRWLWITIGTVSLSIVCFGAGAIVAALRLSQ